MLAKMYFTMLPVILGGIANMIFVKTPLFRKFKKPIDLGKCTKDGKRILGDNKTWFGFLSMIVFVGIFQLGIGYVSEKCSLNHLNEFYNLHNNTMFYNFVVGFSLGFVYMIFELPNSFIKRRIDIPSGKTVSGFKGVLFFIVDQIDSLVGVMFVLYLLSDISFGRYLAYVGVGGLTHIVINLLLKLLKIRRNV